MNKLKKVYKLVRNQETNNSILEKKLKSLINKKLEEKDIILKNKEV